MVGGYVRKSKAKGSSNVSYSVTCATCDEVNILSHREVGGLTLPLLHSSHLYRVHDVHRTSITATLLSHMFSQSQGRAVKQQLRFYSSANMSVNLEGNIFVTGTNRGIGLELVKQLAEKTGKEAHIYACCREPEGTSAEALRGLATQYPGKITIIRLDMSDEDSILTAVQAVSEQIQTAGLNLLINNAAINKPDSLAQLSATGKKDMMEVYETNVAGPFLLAKLFHTLLQTAAEGHTSEGDKMSCRRAAIINISTIISSIEKCPETFAQAKMYPYRTSKSVRRRLFLLFSLVCFCIPPPWLQ